MSLISRNLNPNRSLSLDVFRGLTLAGMTVVNNAGGPQTYKILQHAEWNGCTIADLVFPSFAFILGVALMYSLASRKAKTVWAGLSLFDYLVPIMAVLLYIVKIAVQTGGFRHGPNPPIQFYDLIFPAIIILAVAIPQLERRACAKGGSLYLQVIHHGFLIFAVGFTWSFDPTNPGGYRILGVLHRLGLVYLFAGLIVLAAERRGRLIAAVAGLLTFYWIIMKYVPVPNGCGAGLLTRECNWAGYIDNLLLKGHLYRPDWEPEGILHTIPSVASGLLGALAGGLLLDKNKSLAEKTTGLFVAGNILIVLGLYLNIFFPINKNMWTPSFVIFVAGIDMVILAMCVWFVDHKGVKKAVMPLVYLGANSIFIYLISGLFMHYTSMIPGGVIDGEKINIFKALYVHVYEPTFGRLFTPYIASLALSLTYVALWMAVGGILYKKRVFFKL